MDNELKNKKMIELEKRIGNLRNDHLMLCQVRNFLSKLDDLCNHSFIWKMMVNEDLKSEIISYMTRLNDKIKDIEYEKRKAEEILRDYSVRLSNRRNHIKTEHIGDVAERTNLEKKFGRGTKTC